MAPCDPRRARPALALVHDLDAGNRDRAALGYQVGTDALQRGHLVSPGIGIGDQPLDGAVRASKRGRIADYESSILASSGSGFYLRERETDHRCRPRSDRVFATFMI
jgi:hypothetical protein